jgi:hypothetical protein
MKYFLLPDGETDYKIMKVQIEDLTGFYKRHRTEILLEADSITELLVLIGMKLDNGELANKKQD